MGRVDPADVIDALRDDTALVSLMLANNEVGTLQPVREVAEVCRARGVALHTDAAQAVGKIPVDIADLGVDLLSVAGHKLYAPKGIGALYVRDGVRIVPQIRGAGHERGLRAGTENVLLAVGLGAACDLVHSEVEAGDAAVDHSSGPARGACSVAGYRCSWSNTAIRRTGCPTPRVWRSRDSRPATLLRELGDEVAASAGAACHADGVHVSHVLDAMGIDADLARATVRLSVGRFTTTDEVERAARMILSRINV